MPISDKAKLGAAIDEQLMAMGLKREPFDVKKLRALLIAEGANPDEPGMSAAITAARDEY